MSRRRLRSVHRVVAGLMLTAAALLLAWPMSPAPADPPDATAWWWDAQVSYLVPTPAPPTVPEGGLYVAGEPTGPFGVSAVRLLVPEGGVIGALVLRVASSQGTPAVRACPTEVAWPPEMGGPMSSAPPYDCEANGSIPGMYDEPSKTMSFEVSPLVQGGLLNVVLAPVPGAFFQVSFEKPGADAITVTAPPGTEPGPSLDSGSESYLDAPAFADTADIGSAGVAEGGVPELGAPSIDTTAPTPTTATTLASGRRGVPVVPRTQLAAKATRDPDRVAAALVLMGLVAAYMWLVHQPERMPRRVGPMRVLAGGGQEVMHATAPVVGRGIGRFRRPRTGSAPRL